MILGAPSSQLSKRLSRSARLKAIVDEARSGRTIRIGDLASQFEVSAETIRRDLEQLSKDGVLLRTLGGASSLEAPRDPEFDVRIQQNHLEREQAARMALTLVKDGESLFLSSGITAHEIARQLAETELHLTVVTTSYRVAQMLPGSATIRILMAPGDYDPTERFVSGPETVAFLGRFSFDKVLFGASGLTVDGVTESRSNVAWNLRTALASASRRILVADHSRFDQRQFERVAALSEIDQLACDRPPGGALAEALASAGVSVLSASE